MSAPATHKPIKRTAQQSTAAEPGRSVWVSANAGTGKTRVLVDRIARLLLQGARPEKILCLTFTKTGAAEMAERINAQLGLWAVADDKTLRDDLRHLLGREPDEDAETRARKLFARVLDVPGGLKIRTIHAFCEGLLARFPVEAGVAPHFSVIDERTTAELLNEARERIFERTVRQPGTPLAKALTHLAELVDESGFAQLMRELTGRRAALHEVLARLASQGGFGAAVTRLVGLAEDEQDAEAVLQSAVTSLDESALAHAADALARGAKTSQKMSATLKTFLAMPPAMRAQVFQDTYAPLFVTEKGEARKNLTTKGAEEAENIVRAEQERILAVLEKLRARATADATVSLLTVGRAMIDEYERFKRMRAHLDYDDLIERARALLAQPGGGVSWVHYKLDGGIDHILVDESQDTSPAQWEVVRGLAEDFYTGLSRHEEADETPRTVFAVGDEKQSIYSFQGADPHEFGRMRRHFEARVQAAGQTFTFVPLTTSFRSTRAVLRVVDRVFAQGQARDGLTFDDAHVAHDTQRLGESGLVEVWPTFKPEEQPDDAPWDVPVDYKSRRSPEARLTEHIAATIRGWLDTKEKLKAQDRPIAPGDILILVRRRGSFAEAMVKQLKKMGIPVAGQDRMTLTEQLPVMDLLAAGRFAVLPEDDLSLAETLKSPLCGFDDDALFALAHGRAGSLWAELKRRAHERGDFAQAHGWLSGLLARADAMPPYEFFAELLRDGGRLALTRRLGLDADDPIDEFLGLALDYERTHTPSLQGFLHWVMADSPQIKRDMETGGGQVRVMTVHGAKGLEAPVVFLTDTCKTPDGRLDPKVQWRAEPPALLWSPRAELRCAAFTQWSDAARVEREREYRRLLYVALTRARDRLYVTGHEDKTGRAEGCWYDLIRPVVEDMGQEVPWSDGGESAWRYETEQEVKPEERRKDGAAEAIGEPPAWALTPPRPEPEPARPLAPSAPEAQEPPAFGPFEAEDTRRFQRGLLVHKLLETLPNLPPANREAAARRWLAQPAHGLVDAQQDAIARETLAVLEHPEFAPLFAQDALAEVAVTGVLDGRVVAARLDRLAVLDDRVLVVDYKTNRPPPATPGEVPVAYLRQMAAYKALLGQIYPRKRILPLLLWTDGPRLMALEDAILAGF